MKRVLVALHAPFVAAGPVTTIPRHHLGLAQAGLLTLIALAIGGLQLRHSFAAARGERPAGAGWTFLALSVLVYLPMVWFTWDWSIMQWFVVASGAMILRGPLRILVVAGPILGQTIAAGWAAHQDPGTDVGLLLVVVAYLFTLSAMGSAALYVSPRLVRVLAELDVARTELAELAVGQERLRVSRDLHDLLGQSLSAVSLKGDLALRLLPTDTEAARAEIQSLTAVARGALRDVRAIARAEHGVSLQSEIEAATLLLTAAGITPSVDVDLPHPNGQVENILAWAVREGATNTLRHSQASTWTISTRRRSGTITLEIVNDGADLPSADLPSADQTSPGSGLAGLAERAQALSGTASAGHVGAGRFRLRVEIPEGGS